MNECHTYGNGDPGADPGVLERGLIYIKVFLCGGGIALLILSIFLKCPIKMK